MTPQPEFDPAHLDACLREIIPGLQGPMQLERVHGGQSNPTFFLSFDNRRMVLRKQPPGKLLPSAHAVDREARIMRALADSGVPVPSVLAYVDDAQVIGTPFYVMNRVEGRVFADPFLPGVSPPERAAMFMSMADTLASLHGVDWKAIGLADFGNADDYFQRQIRRWSRQWELSKPAQSDDVDALVQWLESHVPASTVTAISHGDFRIGNLLFHPTEPRVVAVLDWELSTLGHPLADLAYSALAWHLEPSQYMGMKGLDLQGLGIPPEQDYLARYYARAPRSGVLQPFHHVFALFRLAVIFAGIAARARPDDVEKTAANRKLSADFARLAIRAAEAPNGNDFS